LGRKAAHDHAAGHDSVLCPCDQPARGHRANGRHQQQDANGIGEESDATLVNGVITSPMACLRLNGTNILTADAPNQKLGPPVFQSVLMQCGAGPFIGSGGVAAQQVADVFNAGTNNNSAFTSTLTGTFINGANETAATATDPTTLDAAFTATNYVGAVRDASDTWYAGWTCNSSTATFDTTSTACTSLPSL
jgi:hypothetical protein